MIYSIFAIPSKGRPNSFLVYPLAVLTRATAANGFSADTGKTGNPAA
jgi:hypothetical protein